MKKVALGSLLAIVVVLSTAFASTQSIRPEQVVRLTDITKESIEEFFQGNASQIILECIEGESLPFALSIKGEFLSLEVPEGTTLNMKFLKTCFIKSIGNHFLFSTDLQSWKEPQEFFTGVIGISLNIYDDQPGIGLNVELNGKR